MHRGQIQIRFQLFAAAVQVQLGTGHGFGNAAGLDLPRHIRIEQQVFIKILGSRDLGRQCV